jgi:hypothetical protein
MPPSNLFNLSAQRLRVDGTVAAARVRTFFPIPEH